MRVIAEGPDGAGKTFLAERLCVDLGLGYHHEKGPFPVNVLALDYVSNALLAADDMVIDRLALSEMAYALATGRERRLDWWDWTLFCRVMAATGTRHVVCLPDPYTCLAVWRGRIDKEMFKDPRIVFETWSFFSYMAHSLSLLVYDWERDSYGKLLSNLSIRQPVLPTGILGNPFATHLIISRGTTSQALAKLFYEAGYSELDLAWMEALPGAKAPDRRWKVIALGEEGLRACEENGIINCLYLPVNPEIMELWKAR